MFEQLKAEYDEHVKGEHLSYFWSVAYSSSYSPGKGGHQYHPARWISKKRQELGDMPNEHCTGSVQELG